MNTISDWNPIRGLEELENRVLRAFRREASRNGAGITNGEGRTAMPESEWSPPVNIWENESEYVITAELPEVNLPEVRVTLENGILSLKGERKFEHEKPGTRYHLVERSCGTFERRFALPDDADPQKVNANLKEGMLRISIARRESSRPRQIEVRVA